MSSKSRAPLVIPILIIVVGVGWLLTARGFAPGVHWIWTLGLGVVGILSFVLSKGVDKVSVVLGERGAGAVLFAGEPALRIAANRPA
jgi:hypothetical protein